MSHATDFFKTRTMYKTCILLLLSLTLGAYTSIAQQYKPATAEQKKEIQTKVAQASAHTNTLQSPFTQTKELSVLSEIVTSQGMLYFKKQNNVRWQYNTPYSYVFILSNGKVTIINNNKSNTFDANSNKLFKKVSEIMIASVNGTLLSNETEFASQYFVGASTVKVTLIPKDKELKKIMNTISLTFSKTTWLVQTIQMVEQGGDTTTIQFTQHNENKPISDDLFRSTK